MGRRQGDAVRCMRCGACGAVPAVRCLRCGAVRRGAVQSGTTVHRAVGISWVSDLAAPARPADESHLPLAEMHTSRSMSRLLHEHAFHDHVTQTYI